MMTETGRQTNRVTEAGKHDDCLVRWETLREMAVNEGFGAAGAASGQQEQNEMETRAENVSIAGELLLVANEVEMRMAEGSGGRSGGELALLRSAPVTNYFAAHPRPESQCRGGKAKGRGFTVAQTIRRVVLASDGKGSAAAAVSAAAVSAAAAVVRVTRSSGSRGDVD